VIARESVTEMNSETGDRETSIQAVFVWSKKSLTPELTEKLIFNGYCQRETEYRISLALAPQ
jgi:hypothetical protein